MSTPSSAGPRAAEVRLRARGCILTLYIDTEGRVDCAEVRLRARGAPSEQRYWARSSAVALL